MFEYDYKKLFKATSTKYIVVSLTDKGRKVTFTNNIKNKIIKESDVVFINKEYVDKLVISQLG